MIRLCLTGALILASPRGAQYVVRAVSRSSAILFRQNLQFRVDKGYFMPRISLESMVSTDRIKADGSSSFQFIATDNECQQLVDRFGFVSVESVAADFHITKTARDCWDVRGRLLAKLVQSCVITGAPVSEAVDFLIEERYVRTTDNLDEVEVSLDGAEPLYDGQIDIGEMIAQSLAVAVTAWPKASDAPDSFSTGVETSDHPFAELAALKPKRSE